ncbi:acyltransferase [Nocardia sp. NPDC056000]|uniref:acyltransferase n=1 Tax=Nocardia sp. NPDC056000 TaxID=3345674 RepID=UPI0035D5A7FC
MSTATEIQQPAAEIGGGRRKRPYLHQVDLFRIITFCCVIMVHTISSVNDAGSVAANAALALLHFTRYAFFALTGFVLIYQFGHQSLRARSFWPRRFALVGIPYVLWSVIYWAYSIHLGQIHGSVSWLLSRLGLDLLFGTAYYHLYFLLVTMQVYLLFPLLPKLLRRTEGRHRWLLAASAVLHVLVLWTLAYPPFDGGLPAQIWMHVYATVLPYQFFTLLGALAAWHIDAVHAFLREHTRLIVAAVLVIAVAAEGEYQLAVHDGQVAWVASDVFLPERTLWFIAITVGLYLLGTRWADQRQHHDRLAKVVRYGADRSFGVFLIHPFMLELLTPVLLPLAPSIGRFWLTIVLYLGVVAGSLAGTAVLRRSPVSLWLTGRPMLRTDPAALVPPRFRVHSEA